MVPIERDGGIVTYYHSGQLGDLIYALYAIKANGGGNLIVGREQKDTAPCGEPICFRQFEMLLPLLQAQPYIAESWYAATHPGDAAHDLNRFRNYWLQSEVREQHRINTLCKAHFYELGILDKFREDEAWITCSEPIVTNRIIVHRSPRYNSPDSGQEAFPWDALVAEHHQDMLFVGLEQEWEKFQCDFKRRLSFWRVKDFSELARLIAGGKCFCGNQSFPLSIAIGLGQRVLAEACPYTADCRFQRDNYADQLLQPGYSLLTETIK